MFSSQAAGERLLYRLPKPCRGGQSRIELGMSELLGRLVALLRAPRRHRHRYHHLLVTNAPQGGAATVRAGQPLWLVYFFGTVALDRCLDMAKWSVDDRFSVRSGRSTPIR